MIQDWVEVRVDFRLKKSIGEQIYTQLRWAIGQKLLAPGERLPTVRELAGRLSVNFNTVARVYRQLDREGLISTQHGRGTYIVDRGQHPLAPGALPAEAFLKSLDAFLQAKARQYAVSLEDLWACVLSQEKKHLRKIPKQKSTPHKITRKHGRRVSMKGPGGARKIRRTPGQRLSAKKIPGRK